ncbi:hypothetical protein GY45DRAFT_58268 [Cubamyces sp. BRFM 1775]|nr:hypothetical protein GY45DRAFT_58268 [Cubamyces sp. BRFM 1775]
MFVGDSDQPAFPRPRASSCLLSRSSIYRIAQVGRRTTRGRGFILALGLVDVADVATSASPAPLQIRFTTPTVESMMRWEALTPSFIYSHIACQVRVNGVDNLAADITSWFAGRDDGRVWSSNDSLSAIKPSYQLPSPRRPGCYLSFFVNNRRDSTLTRTTFLTLIQFIVTGRVCSPCQRIVSDEATYTVLNTSP